jgi:hypothetical protein
MTALLTTIFDVSWLLAVLGLLIAIWRSSEARLRHAERMEATLIEVATKDAENARQAVESVRMLAAIIQNEQAKIK